MVAEMGIDSLDALKTDFQRIRAALQVKGIPWGIRSIMPAGRVLIHRALVRAEETAEILAMRGYTRGGSFRPLFSTSGGDILAGCCAILVSVIAMVPVSEFFILSH
jgi:energy-coupling factor transport system permease protein